MIDEELRLTLVEHLGELRKRLMISAIAIIIGTAICYNYIQKIIALLIKPAQGLEFIYLSPPELFIAYIKISLILGLFIASPIVLFQIWAFVKPGLKDVEKSYVIFSIFMSVVLLIIGVVFAYLVILPMTIQFFVKMSIDDIVPMFSFESYISYISSILLSFALVFELPLLVLLLNQLGIVNPSSLKKYRKFVILAIFVIAAILTPPDIVSQTLMALPMILLYEFSISIAGIMEKRKKKIKNNN